MNKPIFDHNFKPFITNKYEENLSLIRPLLEEYPS